MHSGAYTIIHILWYRKQMPVLREKHPIKKLLSSLTHVFQNLYDFLSSAKHKRRLLCFPSLIPRSLLSLCLCMCVVVTSTCFCLESSPCAHCQRCFASPVSFITSLPPHQFLLFLLLFSLLFSHVSIVSCQIVLDNPHSDCHSFRK